MSVAPRRGLDQILAPSVDKWTPFEFMPPPWMGHALCAQTDPEMFFPEKGGSTREAKSVCTRCPVAAECFDYALEHRERFGIWGGRSERERKAIRREMGLPDPDDFPDYDEPEEVA